MRAQAAAWVTALTMFATYLRAAGRSPRTVRLRCYYIDRLARDTGAGDPWSVTVDDLLTWLGNPEWKPETRKAARASVCSFYGWAITTGKLPPDDSPADQLPAVNVPRALPRPTPGAVLGRAMLSATDRDRLLLMLAAYAGLRRAEIAAVHPSRDIDRETVELIVRGKGGRERRVPLYPDLLAAIDAELARRREGGHGTGWRYTSGLTADGWLFPGQWGGHLTSGHVGKVLGRLLGDEWTGHTLRHRFGTKAYAGTLDIRAVQELLGHSKVETTQRYVRVPDKAMRAAVMAAGAA